MMITTKFSKLIEHLNILLTKEIKVMFNKLTKLNNLVERN